VPTCRLASGMLWLVCVIVAVASIRWQLRRRDFVDQKWWWPFWAVPLLALIGIVLLWPPLFQLQKALGLLAMPIGLIWLGLLSAVWFAVDQPRLRKGLIALCAAYTLFGNWFGALLLRLLEMPYQGGQDPLELNEGLDAAVVLGGGTSKGPFGPGLGDSGDRLRLGALLYHRGKAEHLVATGRFEGESIGYERDIAAEASMIWQELGVPEHAITMIGGRNTSEEAATVTDLAQEHAWQRVGVISSAWHLPRVEARFADHDVEIVPLPADFRSAWPGFTLYGVIPQADGFAGTNTACWEFVGRLVGR